MKVTVVRYRVKPDRVQENRQLVEQVYAELARTRPSGFRYATLLLPDGVSFLHIASLEGGELPLRTSPAFQAFTKDIAARCDEPPAPLETQLVGNYRLVAE